MYLSSFRRRLLAPLSLLVAALVACAPAEDLASSSDVPSTPAGTASPSPSPSPSAGPTSRTGTPGDSQDDDQDQAEAAGDCDAYLNSSSWCTDAIGDYDCEGGSGNGPNYAPRGVELAESGVDPFGLDANGDGEGCEGSGAAPPPPPEPDEPDEPGSDPRFGTCAEAKAAGYGPYYQGQPEYGWYRDADGDGVVCE